MAATGDTFGNLQLLGNPTFAAQPVQPNSLGEHQVAIRGRFCRFHNEHRRHRHFRRRSGGESAGYISTRRNAGTGASVLIGGLTINGTSPKCRGSRHRAQPNERGINGVLIRLGGEPLNGISGR